MPRSSATASLPYLKEEHKVEKKKIPEEAMAIFELDENCDRLHGSLRGSDPKATPLARCYGFPNECSECEVMKKQ